MDRIIYVVFAFLVVWIFCRTYLTGVLSKDFKVYSASDGRNALTIVNGLKKLPDLILSGKYIYFFNNQI